MNVAVILLLEILFITAVVVFIFSGIVDEADREVMRSVLFKGGVGWGIAFFLRLLPIVLVQRGIIFLLGGGGDLESIQLYALRWEVQIVGPIFAGIFEEVVRFFTIRGSYKIAIDRRVGPLVSGLGWGLGEVIVLFGLNAMTAALSGLSAPIVLSDIFLALLERFSAFLVHISLSYIVFYSLYEVNRVRPSILLAIFLHFLFNSIVVLWVSILSGVSVLSDAVIVWGLELSLLIAALVLLFSVKKIVIPRGERLWSDANSVIDLNP